MEGSFDGDLLRRDPAAYFGLAKGFDARDLRRAYHAAIRVFRPETHPREFQLLREAHDRLARWIGPGGAHREPAAPAEAAVRSPASRSFGSPAERLAAYRERATAPRDPEDFVALALLADSIPSPDRGFDSWILEGLARHPEDDGLESLLRIYQQEDLPPAEVPRFLRRAATVLPPRVAWTATVYAWETAALGRPFPEFLALWDQCGSPQDDIDEGPRAALLAYLLPLLAPSADRKWLEETIAWLARRHDLLRNDGAILDALEAWVPLLEAVEEGRRGPRMEKEGPAARLPNPFHKPKPEPARFPEGSAGDAVKGMLAALLASGCRGGGDRLADAARGALGRTAGILEFFRPPDPELTRILARMARWSGPLAAHHPSFEPAREPKEEGRLVYAVHRKAEAEVLRTKDGFLLGLAKRTGLPLLDPLSLVLAVGLLFFLGLSGLVVLVIGSASNTRHPLAMSLVGIAFMVGSVVGAVKLNKHPPKFGARLQERLAAKTRREAYFNRVRPVLLEAVRDLGLPPEALVDPNVIPAAQVHPLVAWGVAEDPALPILRIAYRFAP